MCIYSFLEFEEEIQKFSLFPFVGLSESQIRGTRETIVLIIPCLLKLNV